MKIKVVSVVMVLCFLLMSTSTLASTSVNNLKNSSPTPPGAESGMFHRCATPVVDRNSGTYTGAVADSVTLPSYNSTASADPTIKEAAYMYTGIDLYNNKGINTGGFEIGFGTNLYGAGWVPVFHVKSGGATYKVVYGQDKTNSKTDNYLVDTRMQYSGGTVISGYKVFFKKKDSVLDVRFLVGGALVYEVQINDVSKVSVKRVTSLACPNNSSTKNTKLRVMYNTGSEAIWGNYRILTNDGTATAYLGEIKKLQEDVWLHGGNITFTKDLISPTLRNEKYKFY